jgi:hypothetical protein
VFGRFFSALFGTLPDSSCELERGRVCVLRSKLQVRSQPIATCNPPGAGRTGGAAPHMHPCFGNGNSLLPTELHVRSTLRPRILEYCNRLRPFPTTSTCRTVNVRFSSFCFVLGKNHRAGSCPPANLIHFLPSPKMSSHSTALFSGDNPILTKYAFGSIIPISVFLVVDRILGIKTSDAEPQFLRSRVPYFGHVIGIIRKGVDYYDEMTQVASNAAKTRLMVVQCEAWKIDLQSSNASRTFVCREFIGTHQINRKGLS